MDIVATVLSDDRVMINNEVYKRLKTIDGKYPQEKRKMYMKKYSKERILRSYLMDDIKQKEVFVNKNK
jgi:flagellar biosynthesis regulator FlbT